MLIPLARCSFQRSAALCIEVSPVYYQNMYGFAGLLWKCKREKGESMAATMGCCPASSYGIEATWS
jgi:hypothetical protein